MTENLTPETLRAAMARIASLTIYSMDTKTYQRIVIAQADGRDHADAWEADRRRMKGLVTLCQDAIAWAKAQYEVRGKMVAGGVPEDEALIAIVERMVAALAAKEKP